MFNGYLILNEPAFFKINFGAQAVGFEKGRDPFLLIPCGMKFCIFVGVNVGGAIGWWLGDRFGIMTAFLVSGAGSIAGVYAGWKLARHFLE